MKILSVNEEFNKILSVYVMKQTSEGNPAKLATEFRPGFIGLESRTIKTSTLFAHIIETQNNILINTQ